MSSFRDLVRSVNAEKESRKSSFRDLVAKVNDGTVKVRSTLTESDVIGWNKAVGDLSRQGYDYLSGDGYKVPNAQLISSIDEHLSKANLVGQYVRANRLNFQDYDKAYQGYADAVNYLRGLKGDISRSNEYYSQWESEDDYNAFISGQEEYEKKLGADTASLERELNDLKAVQTEYNELKRKVQTLAPSQSVAETNRMGQIYQQYGDMDELISEKQAYLNNVRRIQEGVRLAGVADPQSEYYDPEFDAKTGYVSTENDGLDKLFSKYGMGYDDLTYEYINDQNGMREDILQKTAVWNAGGDSLGKTQALKIYDNMTEDEVSIYNYYYATGGKEAAEKYLDSIQETLNYRSAQKRYGKLEGHSGLELLFGVEAGLDQFESGVKNLFNGKDYIAPSDTQILSGMVREDLRDTGSKLPDWMGGASLAQTGYDAISTTANMAPSILTSLAVGTVSKTAGAAMGNALMGASAAGNAYQEKLNMGYTKEQAGVYGVAIGASEIILEKILGGITALGGGTLTKAATKNLSKVDNVLSRFAQSVGGKVLMNAGFEALEEGLQTVLEPYLWQAVSGEEAGVEWEEALYSALLGAVTGGVFEGSGAIINHAQGNAQAQQLYGASQQELVTEALEIDPDNSFAKKMQSKLEGGKNLSGSQLNKLVQQNEAAIKKQGTVAENTAVPDAVETQQIATETKAEATPKTSASVSSQVQSHASEGVYEASEDGKTYFKDEPVNIVGVASVKDSGMKLKLEDGRVVDAKEVQYGSADEAVVYETVASLGVHALGANMLIENYTPGGNVTAKVYAKGIEEAYKLGQMNVPQSELATMPFASELAEYQRQAAYQLGELFGGKQTAKEQATARKNRNAEGTDTSKGRVHFDGDRNSLNKTQKASMDAIEVLAKTLGVQIYVFESEVGSDGKRKGANGWYDPSDGSIHIDLYAGADGKGTMLFTVAHELTHFIRQWSPAKFKVLTNFLMKQYGQRGVSVNELVQNQIDKAKRSGREISYDAAHEEVIADSMETMLADGSVIEMMAELKQQDKTLWAKIRDWFKDLAGKLRAVVEAYKGVKPDSAEGRMVADMKDMIGTLEALYMDALVDASENLDAGVQKNTTSESGVKYQLKAYSEKQIENWKASKRIVVYNSIEQFNQFIRDSIANNTMDKKMYFGAVPSDLAKRILTDTGINVENYNLSLGSYEVRKILKDHGDEGKEAPRGQRAVVPDDFAHIVDIVLDPDKVVLSEDKYMGKPAIVFTGDHNGRMNVVAVVSDKRLDLFVQTVFVNVKKGNLATPTGDQAPINTPEANSGTVSSKKSIRNPKPEVKKKFSLREPVERTKNLVAVHNLSEEKLLKSLKLGGLPMPSIAIIRAQDGHGEFGDISLVFGKDTIDPEVYRTNKLYSGDAWTPMYPKVDYKPSEKVLRKIKDKIYGLVPYEVQNTLGNLMFDTDNASNSLDRYNGNMVEAYKQNDTMKYAYLKDTGSVVSLPMKEADLYYYGEVSNAAVRYFSGKLVNGLQTVELYRNMSGRDVMQDKALMEAVADAQNFDVLRTLEQGSDEYLEYERNPVFRADEVSFQDVDNFLSAARKLFKNGVQQTVDRKAAKELIRDKVDQAAYESWLEDLFSGVVEKEGIRNNKDYLTPSGNRRSFEALHYEHNLENVIKAMRETGEKGIGNGFGGASIFGASTTEFSSIEDMKQSSDRLQMMSYEEYQELRKQFTDRFLEIAIRLPNTKNSFSATDSAAEVLTEAVAKYKTRSGIASYLRRELKGWATYSEQVVDDLITLVNDIRKMPTGYFEAKPRRAVSFDEVATAIVPDSISNDLRDKLEDMDIKFVEYTAGDEEARKKALNSLEGVKFSDRDSAGNQLSREQQEYFKDSKERDGQGRLRVMYRGDTTDVTVFDRKKSSYSNLYGRGFYFTNSDSHAGQYGKARAYFLNVVNPVSTTDCTITKEQMQKFLEAVAENEDDYSFENYGYGATVENVLEGLYTGKSDFAMLYDVSQTAIGDMVAAAELFNEINGTAFDGFILDTETVIFNSNQAKRVDNLNPTSNPDTRFSDRDPDYQRVNKVLEKENAKLKEDVSYLKELVKIQRQVTGGKKFTKSSVEAAAQYLKQNANAKGDTKELAGLLNSLYEHIASAEDLTWESVREQAQPAVDWLQSHVDTKSKRSEYAQDILNQLHGSRVYLDESQIAEAAFRFGSYNDYRRQMMGSITFAKDADTSLDSLWQEFSALYPDVFDSETTSTDMPGALADIIHRLRNSDTTALEYARNREMIAQDLLQQVYDSYWRVSTLYTVADVKQREINRLKGEHFQRMNRLKEQHRENVEKLKQEHKERLEKVRQDYRDRADAKIEKITQKYQESRKKGVEGRRKTEMRHKIQKVVKKLNDLLLNESKDRHVPDSLKKAVAEALDAINMDTVGADERIAKYDDLIAKATDPDVIASLTETRDRIAKSGERLADRIGKLKTAYDSIKTGADSASISVYDEVIAKKIQEVAELVGSTALRDMSYEQLEAVYEMYTMVAKSISNANRSFKEARSATITEMGNSTIREVKAAGGSNQYALKALENTKKFGWDLLKPYYAFSLIGSDTLSKLYDNVRKGEDVWATDVQSAKQFFRQQAEKYGYDDWDLSKEYTFADVSGREFKVGLPQIMSLYAYSKRAQADKHLEKGGFVFDSAVEVVQKKGGIPVKYLVNTANAYNLNRMQINEIVDTLTDDQIAFVDAMQDYLSTVMGEKGNEVSLALYDVRLFKEKNYFPLKSASQYTFQQTENTGEVKLKNSGFSKKTVVNASNPIILSDFMNVWGGHVNDMSMYHAFVLPLEDFNRVYNYKTLTSEETSTQSVKAALQNAYGTASTKYIKQMLEDINGGARADDRASILSRWMGKFKKGSVFANASVVIQQPSAIARAAALIDLQHFIGPKISQKRHKQLWDEVKQYAPVAIIKEMGYFDTNMGLSTVEYLTAKEYETIGDKAKAMFTDGNYRDEVLSRPAALADELSWCYIWEAVKRETRGNNPGVDVRSEQFLKKAGDRFTEVVTRTQVYDSVLSRSGLMRSKDTGAKMMTAFMSEPTTSINMVFDALVQGKRGNRWYTRNAIGAVVASQILNSLLVSIVYAARDDDEDKRPGGKFCVSVFRQNQEYHVIDVHDGAYSPWLQLSRKVGAVCAPCTA